MAGQHGGRRQGAGRPSLASEGRQRKDDVVRAVVSAEQRAYLEALAVQRECSLGEALRLIIDAARGGQLSP